MLGEDADPLGCRLALPFEEACRNALNHFAQAHELGLPFVGPRPFHAVEVVQRATAYLAVDHFRAVHHREQKCHPRRVIPLEVATRQLNGVFLWGSLRSARQYQPSVSPVARCDASVRPIAREAKSANTTAASSRL